MMRKKLAITLFCGLVAVGLYLLFFKNTADQATVSSRDNTVEKDNPRGVGSSQSNGSQGEEGVSTPDPYLLNDTRLARQPDGSVHFLPAVEIANTLKPNDPIIAGIEALESVLGHYLFAFRENPIGENAEITRQLTGKNPKKVVFITSDSIALKDGQIVDNLGTPYFFHSLSATEMEIRSAGVDRVMWTDDDISSHE